MTNPVGSLQEHLGVILGLLTTITGVAVFLFWRMIISIEKKQREIEKELKNHLLSCKDEFVSQARFDREHVDYWEAINELRRKVWGKLGSGD